MFLSLGVSSAVCAQGILLFSQNDGNAAQHPPVNFHGSCACATSPISIRHLAEKELSPWSMQNYERSVIFIFTPAETHTLFYAKVFGTYD